MMVILAAIFGFLGSVLPEFMKFFQDKQDKQHELDMTDKQIEFQKLNLSSQLEAVNMQAHATEMTALYDYAKTENPNVKAFEGYVRNILACAFFFIYFLAKAPKIWLLFTLMDKFNQVPFEFIAQMADLVWDDSDDAIFASIISFFFGRMTINKFKG